MDLSNTICVSRRKRSAEFNVWQFRWTQQRVDGLAKLLQLFQGAEGKWFQKYNCWISSSGVDPRVEVYYQLFWHDSLRSLLKKFPNVNSVFGSYKEKSPTSTKVVKKLIFSDDLNERQKQVSGFLKKYIKSLDKKDLRLFLRFVVGSDNMPVAINALQIKYSCAKISCVYQPTWVGRELPVN